MIKKISLTLLILTICLFSSARFVDNYGIKIGAGLSSQLWEYKTMVSDLSGWKRNKISLAGKFYVEKHIGKYISLSPAIGYTQKGFVEDVLLFGADDEKLGIFDNRVVLHDLSLDMSFKIIPFQSFIKPYLLFGLRGDYLLDTKSVFVNFNGKNYESDTSFYDKLNKFTLSGLVGIGILYNDLISVEFEFNPAISRNFNSDLLAIHDRFYSLTLGININKR
jgi:hypothetical protein